MAYNKNYNNEEKKTVFEKRDEFYENLTNKIIERMEDDIKYQKAWMVVEQLPYNPSTGTVYQGTNAVNLLCSGRGDPRWLTFKQIQDASTKDKAEYRVKKGEKAETIIIYTPFAQKDENGNIVRDENGKPKLVRDENGEPKLTLNVYKVFNAEQIEGYPPLEITGRDNPSFEPAEQLVEAMKKDGVDFKHHTMDKAYYSPGQDAVRVPPIEAFSSSEAYYRTVIHELSHATGHEKRLNRDQTGSMFALNNEDLAKYAKEELTAEMSSYFTGASIGVPYNPEVHENHAAYLKSWLSVLKDEETGRASKDGVKFLREACESGKKACSYQLDKLEKYLALEQSNELKQDEVKKVYEVKEITSLDDLIKEYEIVKTAHAQAKQDFKDEKISDTALGYFEVREKTFPTFTPDDKEIKVSKDLVDKFNIWKNAEELKNAPKQDNPNVQIIPPKQQNKVAIRM